MIGTSPPVPPEFPCRKCGTPLPFGAKVCLRCGASTDFVPAAERANNTAATLLGVAATLAILFVLPIVEFSLVNRPGVVSSAQSSAALLLSFLEITLFLALVVVSAVLVARNPRQSPRRAFGYAALITTAVFVGCGIIALAALFFICVAALRHG